MHKPLIFYCARALSLKKLRKLSLGWLFQYIANLNLCGFHLMQKRLQKRGTKKFIGFNKQCRTHTRPHKHWSGVRQAIGSFPPGQCFFLFLFSFIASLVLFTFCWTVIGNFNNNDGNENVLKTKQTNKNQCAYPLPLHVYYITLFGTFLCGYFKTWT